MKSLWRLIARAIGLVQQLVGRYPVRTAGLITAGLVALAVRFGFNRDTSYAYIASAVPVVLAEFVHWQVSPTSSVDFAKFQSILLSVQGYLAQFDTELTASMAPVAANTSIASADYVMSTPIHDQLVRDLSVPPVLNRYGLIPDVPDQRDHLVPKVTRARVAKLPAAVDLRTDARMPAVWDQGQLGSCTAHGIGAALMFHEVAPVMPSRLFLYYNERALEHTVGSDSGAQIRDGFKVSAKQGVCPEPEWPYDIAKFTAKPPAKCYTDAKLEVALTYQRVAQDVDQIRAQLAAGNLVVIGFSVYESFESETVAKTGVLNLPKKGEQLLGGHCVAIVGYQHSVKRFIVRNSWGAAWGQAGYFSMPYSYVTNRGLASDFWTVSKVGAA